MESCVGHQPLLVVVDVYSREGTTWRTAIASGCSMQLGVEPGGCAEILELLAA